MSAGDGGRRPKTRIGRVLHVLRQDLADYFFCLAFLPFLAFVLLGWDIAASHATDTLGLLALAAGGIGLLLRGFWGASVWLMAGLLFLSPSIVTMLIAAPSHATGCRITVMDFNTKLTRSPAEADVANIIAAGDADLVFLQEIARPELLQAILKPRLPASYQWTASDNGSGAFILSRFPIEHDGIDGGLLTATVRIEGRPVSLTTARGPKPFQSQEEAEDFMRQLDRLIAKSHGPLLAGLDLNAGPWSTVVRNLSQTLIDVYPAVGSGFGATFPTRTRGSGLLGTWLRIDYLFASRDFAPEQAEVLRAHGGSTHYPVRAELTFVDQGKAGQPCDAK